MKKTAAQVAEVRWPIAGHGEPRVRFSPDGRYLVELEPQWRARSARTGRLLAQHPHPAEYPSFFTDDRRFVAVSLFESRIFSSDLRRQLALVPGPILLLLPGERAILAVLEKRVHPCIWDIRRGRIACELPDLSYSVLASSHPLSGELDSDELMAAGGECRVISDAAFVGEGAKVFAGARGGPTGWIETATGKRLPPPIDEELEWSSRSPAGNSRWRWRPGGNTSWGSGGM